MAPEKTLAYVIQTRDYRDTSLIGTFFTQDFGKIKAVLKGGRDARGRWGSSLEPFSLNEIILYRRRRGDLHLVTQAELEDRFDALRSDLERLGTATYFMELVDQMVDQHPHPEIFKLIEEAFSFLSQGHSIKRAARIFEIKLMDRLGFMPELGQCVRCSRKNPKDFYFSVYSGGIVCSTCRSTEGPLLIVSKGCLVFLDQACKKSFSQLGAIKVSQEVGVKLEQMMGQFLEQHLAYRPKSLVFLEKIAASQRHEEMEKKGRALSRAH